ncbi:MAG: heparan-alpha-glucosaminide N-acetyltransferase domain-containing protein [Ignavibacteria bacterium]
MNQDKTKNRIIFIDLMRAFAVLMMVQGHTVDTFLADSYRTFDSPFFNFWNFMRGLTAPIFLFAAGTVFTYLLRVNKLPYKKNPRVKKGLKRFFMLILLAYFMRYPTPYIVYFKDVTWYQWQNFFAVDVLHLIAFGILFVLGLAYIAERFKIREQIIYSSAAFISFVLYAPFSKIYWVSFLPVPIAGYFYQGTGSIFPLVPWVGFVFSGAALGKYLAENPNIFKSREFSIRLLYTGLFFVGISLIGNLFEFALYGESHFWTTSPNLIFFRLGIVILLNSAVSYFSIKVERVPKLFAQIGRNSLSIYVVHVIILYGSAWTLGLWSVFAKSFDILSTIGATIIMISLMVSMVQGFQMVKVRIKRKEFVS